MEWVAIDVHIAGDAVTHRLADQFRLRVAEAAGLLTLAFAGMAQHAQAGELADITDSQIEAWATWHGKRGQFAAFFRAQLCDEHGTVRAWETYNGANIREAKAARARMQAYRAKKKTEREANSSPDGTENGTANGTRDVRHNMTGQDSSTTKATDTPPAATIVRTRSPRPKPAPAAPDDNPLPKSLCDPAFERYVSRIGPVEYPRFRKALLPAYRAKEGHHPTLDELYAGIEAYREARAAAGAQWYGSYTAEKFAQSLHEFIRLGQMPLVDGWGEPTERGRAAKVAA